MLITSIAAVLLRMGRWRLFRPLVKFFWNYMDQLLPVDKLYENEFWFAFQHPQPEYVFHLLILPRQGIPTLSKAPQDRPDLYNALFQAVRELVAHYQLEARGYRLITNGGLNQTIPQGHWHLVSDQPEEVHA